MFHGVFGDGIPGYPMPQPQGKSCCDGWGSWGAWYRLPGIKMICRIIMPPVIDPEKGTFLVETIPPTFNSRQGLCEFVGRYQIFLTWIVGYF